MNDRMFYSLVTITADRSLPKNNKSAIFYYSQLEKVEGSSSYIICTSRRLKGSLHEAKILLGCPSFHIRYSKTLSIKTYMNTLNASLFCTGITRLACVSIS